MQWVNTIDLFSVLSGIVFIKAFNQQTVLVLNALVIRMGEQSERRWGCTPGLTIMVLTHARARAHTHTHTHTHFKILSLHCSKNYSTKRRNVHLRKVIRGKSYCIVSLREERRTLIKGMWQPQYMAQMNLSTEKKQTHGHGEQTCGCQGEGKGMRCAVNLGLVEIWTIAFGVD